MLMSNSIQYLYDKTADIELIFWLDTASISNTEPYSQSTAYVKQ